MLSGREPNLRSANRISSALAANLSSRPAPLPSFSSKSVMRQPRGS
jgi:hypothetical protein